MVEVKICGVRTAEAMDAVAGAGAEWVGFNFFAPSPRAVDPGEAARLLAAHPDGPAPVGLFVDPTDDEVAAVLGVVRLAAVQLHGPAGRVGALAGRFGLPVWHAVGVAAAGDLPEAAGAASRLLLDAKAPPGAVLPGGNAAAFDWGVLEGWRSPGPWMLAGGLTPGNVAEAVRRSGAPGVDVASGVERGRGDKDPALIHAFVQAARGG